MRTYRNMESRVTGIQWRKAHLYEGKAILDRECFYQWSLANDDFFTLYNAWVEAGYSQRLTPSIDRKEPKLGYTFGNIRWLTHSENSRLGSLSPRKQRQLS
jgi:hypothetical protein